MTRIHLPHPGLLILAAVVALAAACGSGGDDNTPPTATRAPSGSPTALSASSPTEFPLEVQRSDGKTLRLEAPAERIVSLSPGATESLYAIGAEGALVAVDNQADYPQAAQDFATKVDAYEPNIEAIAALEPDLVIVADDVGGIVEALDRLQIPVLYLDLDVDLTTVDEVLANIRQLGAITGHDAASEELVTELRGRLQRVEQTVADADGTPLSVYHELDDTFYSVSEDTFIGSLYTLLGAGNIAGDGGGVAYPQLTQEAIIAADPDVIVLADEEFGVSVDSVKARPGWDAIKAVRDGRIYAIDPDIISRPGPRIIDALEQLAQKLYPEAVR